MSWKLSGLLLLGLVLSIITITILPSILIELWYFAIGLLIVIGLSVIWLAFTWALMVREKMLMVKAQRKREEYQIHTDGLGQSFVIKDGQIVSLTTNPRTHINGHYEPATQEEVALQLAFYAAIAKSKQQVESPAQFLLPASVEATPELMPILNNAQRVLIKAASNGGKTTLLQHIAAKRNQSESVLIIDSQSYPEKWPNGCKVVGTGSDHKAISNTLDNLIDIMVKRYREIGEGLVREGAHPKLTIIIDEWMAIVSECPNASDVIRRLLTESRKAAFSVFIGSHSERVKALGLDGRGDLRDGFLIVRIELENGNRVATYDTGRGEMPCLLPGQFVQAQSNSPFEIEAIEQPIVTDEEQRILDMIEQGESYRAISKAVWGGVGSFYNQKIIQIARKHGCEV